jgi:hypothetical protein
MKNVSVCLQHKNMEYADFLPFLMQVTDEEFDKLESFKERNETLTGEEYGYIKAIFNDSPYVELPCEVHGVYMFWYEF